MRSVLAATALLALSPTIIASSSAQGDLSSFVRERVSPWSGEGSPGGALCVLQGDEPVVLEVFGMADLAAKRPITLETPFYIASLAKTFTAFCAMQAAREGDLDLDASLREHFPELSEPHGGASLRHAMHHTSGVIDLYDATIAGDLPLEVLGSNTRALELLARFPGPMFEADSRFLYCNSGYVLLAEALQRSTGQTLADYAQEHVFEPYGMEGAHYLGQGDEELDAISYRRTGDGWERLAIKTGLYGPGGMYASAQDLLEFARGLREDLASKRVAGLFDATPGAQHPRLGAYGAGWMIARVEGLPAQRHHGGGFGFSADLLRFPDQDVTIVALSNAENLSAISLSEGVAAHYLAEDIRAIEATAPKAFPLQPEDVTRFGRIWHSSSSDQVYILTPKRPGFVVAALGDLKLNLVPVSQTRLESPEALVPFALELKGEHLELQVGGRAPEKLTQMPFPPTDLPPASDFAGEYSSEVLQSTIRFEPGPRNFLVLEQNEPLIELPPFMPLGPDLYFCDKGARLDFQRDAEGRVTGLTFHANRARGLEFERVD